ncbi:UbiA prenyltransferase family protein [Flavobacterium rhizosphaerae]|uniref:Prenyltransferase n=1 Tax=Flavobacterium rhizosphaerae TaxID=3163298 RepID=A0ABW8YVP4_9FLAO
MKILKYINIKYLLLLIVGMLVFKFGLLQTQPGYSSVLNTMHYFILIVACVFIAAGGFFVNNVMGIGKQTDIPESKAFNIYLILTGIGLLSGLYIANYIGKPFFTGAFIVGAAVFYIYATSLKQVMILNNIVAALLSILPFFIIISFDLSPSVAFSDKVMARTLLGLFIDYSVFIFVLALITGIINDLANTDGDYNEGLNTLPIVLGRSRTTKIIFFVSLVLPFLLLVYTDMYLTNLLYAFAYILVFIAGPLIYYHIKLWTAATPKDFVHLEKVLFFVALFSLLSIAVITYNIKLNVTG